MAEVARSRGLVAHELNNARQFDRKAPMEEHVAPPIEAWLKGFDDAQLVLTDSFHGCVFSIVFRKPFMAIGNRGRGLSRMESLMRMFGLEDHLLSSLSDYDSAKSYVMPINIDARHFAPFAVFDAPIFIASVALPQSLHERRINNFAFFED